MSFESKYDCDLPSFDECTFDESISKERTRLIAATAELDKIKSEMEARIRYEMEEKIKSDLKEREEKELKILISSLSSDLKKEWHHHHQLFDKLLPSENPLYYSSFRSGINCYTIFITTHRLVILYNLNFRPLYTFSSTLNLKQITMLGYIKKGETDCYAPINKRSISFRMSGEANGVPEYIALDALNKFQSIIRSIPGSYSNGNWKQLDGFFGMYLNEETYELAEIPPPYVYEE